MFNVKDKFIDIKSLLIINERFLKIIFICGFISVIFNFFILYLHIPQGYVADIYSVLPIYFFFISIFCYIIASYVILLPNTKILRKLSVFLLIFNHLIILLIPFMLGYHSMGRADDMSYIGEYLHIRSSGNINYNWDIYPASHIIGATISIISDLPVNIVSFIIPILFSFIFIAGLILFCNFFFNQKILQNIVICTSFVFYLGPYNFLNVPHALFFAFIPLFILIILYYLKNKTFEFLLLSIITILLIPFTHPFIVFFVIFLFIYFIIINKIKNQFIEHQTKNIGNLLFILIVSFFSWFIYFSTLLYSFKISLKSYFQRITETAFIETVEKLNKINLDTYKLMKLILIYYGRYIIPLIIILIGCLILYLCKNKIKSTIKNQFNFFLIFYIYLFIIMGIIFFNPIISHHPDRLTNLNFIVYGQIPLFVLAIYFMSKKINSINQRILLFILILGCTWNLSLFGTFDSPNIFRPNVALTYNEVQGMTWFYKVRDNENLIVPLSQISRFHTLFNDNNKDYIYSIKDHFGYNSPYVTFLEANTLFNKEIFIILLTIDEILYQQIPGYTDVGRYTKEDFIRFRNDKSINAKIYHNKNIEIYKIY